jgi:hypothetical protein
LSAQNIRLEEKGCSRSRFSVFEDLFFNGLCLVAEGSVMIEALKELKLNNYDDRDEMST